MTDIDRCDVLILGASFAGIEVLHQLRRSRAGRELSVVVVDRQAEHGYIPLCQERLVERLPPERSALATADCVALDPHARYVVGEVVTFAATDPGGIVELASGARVLGRYVVIALGSVLAPPPALPGGERLLGYKLGPEFAASRARLAALLGGAAEGAAPGAPGPRVVVIGGGVSGVELAGELAHLAQVRPAGWVAPQVTLVDGGDRLLRGLCGRAARQALRALQRQGVDVRLGTRVVQVDADAVELRAASGVAERLPCAAAFWAGGVRPAPLLARMALPHTSAGWLAVGPTLQCFVDVSVARPELFACGDAVRILGGTGEWPTMQRAIECLWQAKVVARNILRLASRPSGDPRGPAPLRPHRLREDFAYGVSIGARSLIAYGPVSVDLGVLGVWFRRFLMRQYFARYGGPRPPTSAARAIGPASTS